MNLAVARQGGKRRILHARNGIPDLCILYIFYACCKKPYLTRGERIRQLKTERAQVSGFKHGKPRSGGEHFDFKPGLNNPVHNPDINYNAAIRVILTVEYNSTKRRVVIPGGWRDVCCYTFEYVFNVLSEFGGDKGSVRRRDSDYILNFLLYALRVSAGQIYFINHGNDLKTVLYSKVGVCEGLRLNTLSRVHDQNRALTSRK